MSKFNVYFTTSWAPNCITEEFKESTTAERALRAFARLTKVPGVDRVYIVSSSDDFITLDWTALNGVVFPPPTDDSKLATTLRNTFPPVPQ